MNSPTPRQQQVSQADISFAVHLLKQEEAPETVRRELEARGLPQEAAAGLVNAVITWVIYPAAESLLDEGASPDEVKRKLMGKRLSEDEANHVVEDLLKQRQATQGLASRVWRRVGDIPVIGVRLQGVLLVVTGLVLMWVLLPVLIGIGWLFAKLTGTTKVIVVVHLAALALVLSLVGWIQALVGVPFRRIARKFDESEGFMKFGFTVLVLVVVAAFFPLGWWAFKSSLNFAAKIMPGLPPVKDLF
jgi:hypothetical protein